MIYRCYFHQFSGRLETVGERKRPPLLPSPWQNNIHNIALGVFTCWIVLYRNEIITHTWQSFPHTFVCLSMNWWMCSRLPAGTVINCSDCTANWISLSFIFYFFLNVFVQTRKACTNRTNRGDIKPSRGRSEVQIMFKWIQSSGF